MGGEMGGGGGVRGEERRGGVRGKERLVGEGGA